jgi:hypothetical protein
MKEHGGKVQRLKSLMARMHDHESKDCYLKRMPQKKEMELD